MRPIYTSITNRNLSFAEYDTTKNWIADFPTKNWCLIIIADEKQPKYFGEIIRKSIDRDVGYICAIGEQHDLVHNMADEEIAFRDIDFDQHYLPKHCIMTVGDDDFENGIWFGINCTFNDGSDISNIVTLDLTKKALDRILKLIEKFENGYLPPDN